jgi:hypothetical protein
MLYSVYAALLCAAFASAAPFTKDCAGATVTTIDTGTGGSVDSVLITNCKVTERISIYSVTPGGTIEIRNTVGAFISFGRDVVDVDITIDTVSMYTAGSTGLGFFKGMTNGALTVRDVNVTGHQGLVLGYQTNVKTLFINVNVTGRVFGLHMGQALSNGSMTVVGGSYTTEARYGPCFRLIGSLMNATVSLSGVHMDGKESLAVSAVKRSTITVEDPDFQAGGIEFAGHVEASSFLLRGGKVLASGPALKFRFNVADSNITIDGVNMTSRSAAIDMCVNGELISSNVSVTNTDMAAKSGGVVFAGPVSAGSRAFIDNVTWFEPYSLCCMWNSGRTVMMKRAWTDSFITACNFSPIKSYMISATYNTVVNICGSTGTASKTASSTLIVPPTTTAAPTTAAPPTTTGAPPTTTATPTTLTPTAAPTTQTPATPPVTSQPAAPTTTAAPPVGGGAAEEEGSSNTGTIIGVVVGVVVLLAACCLAAVWWFKLRRKAPVGHVGMDDEMMSDRLNDPDL